MALLRRRKSQAITAATRPIRMAFGDLVRREVFGLSWRVVGATCTCDYLWTARLSETSSSSPVRLIPSLVPKS